MTIPLRPEPLLTAEEADALATADYYRRLRKEQRKGRIPRAVRDMSRLRPWMQAYAYWYALAPKTTLTECCVEASRQARDQVSRPMIRHLHARPDFRALVEKFQTGEVEGAIAKYKADLPFYVETHRQGLERALANDDYKSIPKFTEHALQVVAPARNDLAQQNLQVNVVFTPKEMAVEEMPPLETTWEVVQKDSDKS